MSSNNCIIKTDDPRVFIIPSEVLRSYNEQKNATLERINTYLYGNYDIVSNTSVSLNDDPSVFIIPKDVLEAHKKQHLETLERINTYLYGKCYVVNQQPVTPPQELKASSLSDNSVGTSRLWTYLSHNESVTVEVAEPQAIHELPSFPYSAAEQEKISSIVAELVKNLRNKTSCQ
jgi:hypothetical protein